MGIEMTDQMPREMRQRFRVAILSLLSLDPSTTWRIRRIDRFSGIDWDYFQQSTSLDFRLTNRLLRSALETLQEACAERDDCERQDECITSLLMSEDLVAPGTSGPIGSVDLFIPVLWVPGPLMDFSMTMNGKEVVALSRRETADIFSRLVSSLLRQAIDIGLISAPTEDPQLSERVLSDLGWVLTATDVHALRTSASLADLKKRQSAANHYALIETWLLDNMHQANISHDVAVEALELFKPDIQDILDEAKANALRYEELRDAGYDLPPLDALSPCTNPIFMHMSLLKMVKWFETTSREHFLVQETNHALPYFLTVCGYWNKVLSEVIAGLSARPAGMKDSPQQLPLLQQLLRLSDNWPLLVRVTIPPDQLIRFEVRQAIYAPTRSNSVAAARGAATSPRKWLQHKIERFPVWLWSGLSWILDTVRIEWLGLRTRFFSQRNTQAYPIAIHDSLSLHVEVACERSELLLVPRSAFVKYKQTEFPNSFVKEVASRIQSVANALPDTKIPVTAVFGRVTDDGQRIQHFYTTKTSQENTRRDDDYSSKCRYRGSTPYLVVHYRVTRYVALANQLVVFLVVGLGLLLLRTSFFDSALSTSPGNLADEVLIDFIPVLTATIPALTASLLLFAFEKHSDLLVAEVSSRYSRWVFWSGLVTMIAALGRAAVVSPYALPFPQLWINRVQGPWLTVSKWYVLHEVYLVGWMSKALLAAVFFLGMCPVLFWLLLTAVGNRIDTEAGQVAEEPSA